MSLALACDSILNDGTGCDAWGAPDWVHGCGLTPGHKGDGGGDRRIALHRCPCGKTWRRRGE